MRFHRLAAGVVTATLAIAATTSAGTRAAHDLPRSSPERQGVSSAGLLSFVEAVDRLDSLHGFVLVRHGHVVAEGYWSPYDAETRHTLFSLTKSFTSTAVGFAVTEGKVRVDDPVLPYFPEDAPAEPSDNLKGLRVRDLLTMSTGQHAEAKLGDAEPWTKSFLAEPVVHKPGTFFMYNTPASYMLSAIVQKATGQTELEYLRTRLFEPLGIDDPVWAASPQGVSIGGYGLKIRTREIARFGQFLLQKGEWEGKRLLPASWIETATARQTSNGSNPSSDWDQGYGFQFWRCRHGVFRGDGAFGQFCIVMQEQDAVLAITSGIGDMGSVLNAVWDHLLPALKASALPEDDAARGRLETAVAALRLRMPQGSATPAVPTGRRYVFPANDEKIEQIGLEDGGAALAVTVAGVEHRIPVGRGEWVKSRFSPAPSAPEQPIAASGAWTAPDTFQVKLALLEEPFVMTHTLRFAGDQVFYDHEMNVGFGSTKRPQLVGTAR
jgi:CubicO group peptidase (beta-lactamase class C family)